MNTYAAFAVATLERAAKTFAQALGALLVAAGTGLLDTAWMTSLSVAGMAAVLSVLTSVGSAPFGGAVGPSLANEDVDRGHADLATVLIGLACAVVVLALYVAFVR